MEFILFIGVCLFYSLLIRIGYDFDGRSLLCRLASFGMNSFASFMSIKASTTLLITFEAIYSLFYSIIVSVSNRSVLLIQYYSFPFLLIHYYLDFNFVKTTPYLINKF
jgi:hypothetical protein